MRIPHILFMNSFWQSLLLSGLFFSSLYYSANDGGEGLSLPFNIPIWFFASSFIALGLWVFSRRSAFSYPKLWPYFALFPAVIIASNQLADIGLQTDWYFRKLFILGGVFFMLALFQLRPKQQTLDRVLLALLAVMAGHAFVGIMQITYSGVSFSWFPNYYDGVPRGVFQQINVQASFLATGLISSLYFISRPSFRFGANSTKLLVIIAFGMAFYIVIASGSRVGTYSLFVGIPIMLLCRWQQLRRHKTVLSLLLIVAILGLWQGQMGLSTTMDKTARLTEESYSSARGIMYGIGFEAMKEKPLQGHGIGYFMRTWNEKSIAYLKQHPDAKIPYPVNHPHNELLLWMIEGGVSAVVGIITIMLGLSIALYRCGIRRGGAYAAMLLPISLHTQLEYPFYQSALHWFIWLFLVYLVLRHQIKTRHFTLSVMATRFTAILAIVFILVSGTFLINTARAQVDYYNSAYIKTTPAPRFKLALNNHYFKPKTTYLAMRYFLLTAIQEKNKVDVAEFEQWAQGYVVYMPKLDLYTDLIKASRFLRPKGKGCDAIYSAVEVYPQHQLYVAAKKDCITSDRAHALQEGE